MSRILKIGAAQSGPVNNFEKKSDVVERLINLLKMAHKQGCELVVFTECALTPFFPHWWIDNIVEFESYFEISMPNKEVDPLFNEAKYLGISFYLGYAELDCVNGVKRYYNSSVLVDNNGIIVGKYRKIHLPGHYEYRPLNKFQNLEKRYFNIGNLGFQVFKLYNTKIGMCICNDRRWPETFRTLALSGAEIILLGYNTPVHCPDFPDINQFVSMHNLLCLQAGAYQNSVWIVSVAKAGTEEGVVQLGESTIISPTGEVKVMSKTLDDELIVHECDLSIGEYYKREIFNFKKNRKPEYYKIISDIKQNIII